jgi:phage-related protein
MGKSSNWLILFYEDRRGKSPALDFINALSAKDRAKVNIAFRLLAEFGTRLGMPHAKRIDGRLWELRPGDNRLFYFLHLENRFVVLHGFRKKSMKTPEKEIAIALRRMNELLEEE